MSQQKWRVEIVLASGETPIQTGKSINGFFLTISTEATASDFLKQATVRFKQCFPALQHFAPHLRSPCSNKGIHFKDDEIIFKAYSPEDVKVIIIPLADLKNPWKRMAVDMEPEILVQSTAPPASMRRLSPLLPVRDSDGFAIPSTRKRLRLSEEALAQSNLARLPSHGPLTPRSYNTSFSRENKTPTSAQIPGKQPASVHQLPSAPPSDQPSGSSIRAIGRHERSIPPSSVSAISRLSEAPSVSSLVSNPRSVISQGAKISTKIYWTEVEDAQLLEGLRMGLNSSQTLEKFNMQRSSSAARSRRISLLKKDSSLSSSLAPGQKSKSSSPFTFVGSSSPFVGTPSPAGLDDFTTSELSELETAFHGALDAETIHSQETFQSRTFEQVQKHYKALESKYINDHRDSLDWPRSVPTMTGWGEPQNGSLRRAYKFGLGLDTMRDRFFKSFSEVAVHNKLKAYRMQMIELGLLTTPSKTSSRLRLVTDQRSPRTHDSIEKSQRQSLAFRSIVGPQTDIGRSTVDPPPNRDNKCEASAIPSKAQKGRQGLLSFKRLKGKEPVLPVKTLYAELEEKYTKPPPAVSSFRSNDSMNQDVSPAFGTNGTVSSGTGVSSINAKAPLPFDHSSTPLALESSYPSSTGTGNGLPWSRQNGVQDSDYVQSPGRKGTFVIPGSTIVSSLPTSGRFEGTSTEQPSIGDDLSVLPELQKRTTIQPQSRPSTAETFHSFPNADTQFMPTWMVYDKNCGRSSSPESYHSGEEEKPASNPVLEFSQSNLLGSESRPGTASTYRTSQEAPMPDLQTSPAIITRPDARLLVLDRVEVPVSVPSKEPEEQRPFEDLQRSSHILEPEIDLTLGATPFPARNVTKKSSQKNAEQVKSIPGRLSRLQRRTTSLTGQSSTFLNDSIFEIPDDESPVHSEPEQPWIMQNGASPSVYAQHQLEGTEDQVERESNLAAKSIISQDSKSFDPSRFNPLMLEENPTLENFVFHLGDASQSDSMCDIEEILRALPGVTFTNRSLETVETMEEMHAKMLKEQEALLSSDDDDDDDDGDMDDGPSGKEMLPQFTGNRLGSTPLNSMEHNFVACSSPPANSTGVTSSAKARAATSPGSSENQAENQADNRGTVIRESDETHLHEFQSILNTSPVHSVTAQLDQKSEDLPVAKDGIARRDSPTPSVSDWLLGSTGNTGETTAMTFASRPVVSIRPQFIAHAPLIVAEDIESDDESHPMQDLELLSTQQIDSHIASIPDDFSFLSSPAPTPRKAPLKSALRKSKANSPVSDVLNGSIAVPASAPPTPPEEPLFDNGPDVSEPRLLAGNGADEVIVDFIPVSTTHSCISTPQVEKQRGVEISGSSPNPHSFSIEPIVPVTMMQDQESLPKAIQQSSKRKRDSDVQQSREATSTTQLLRSQLSSSPARQSAARRADMLEICSPQHISIEAASTTHLLRPQLSESITAAWSSLQADPADFHASRHQITEAPSTTHLSKPRRFSGLAAGPHNKTSRHKHKKSKRERRAERGQ